MASQGNPRNGAWRLGMSSLSVAILAACGGGGSGGIVRPVDPPPSAPPPTPPVVYDPEPDFSKHLTLTNAGEAHDAGLTGEGYRIGVVDSGVTSTHPALNPRVLVNLFYLDPTRNDQTVDDVDGHGTGVSQIMAGTPFGAWPGGIAPGAEIVSARIISDEPPVDDGSGEGNEVDGALGLEGIHDDLIDYDVRIMNNSWGGLYWDDVGATDPIAEEYRRFIHDNDGLVVFATGNESFADPTDMAALPSQPGPNGTRPAADLEEGWIAVAALATESPTELATYSNACGLAMSYCMVAPGDVVVTGKDDEPDAPTYWNWSGTSLAAPLVSGAAALVWEAFPYFHNNLVRQTLLGTAQDLGAPGTDEVFGNGLLDIGAAIRGPSRLDWGDVAVRIDGGSSTWSNELFGNGTLTKQGAGSLYLDNDASFDGGIQVAGGALVSAGSITGDVGVGTNGAFGFGTGLVGDLDNDGWVQVTLDEAGTGSMSVGMDGNYTHGSDATLAIELGTEFHVSGTASIQGGDVHVLGVREDYVSGAREEFLYAESGLTGSFDDITTASGVFLEATLGYDSNWAWLDIDRLDVTAAAQSYGFTAVSVGSATRVETAFRAIDGTEGADGAPVGVNGDFLGAAGQFQRTASLAAAEQSLASLSGEMHAADAAFTMMALEGSRHALESRLDAIGNGIAAGAWADRINGQRGWSHAEFDASGWTIGQDFRVAPGLVMGASFSETDGVAGHGLRGDRERNRQTEGQVHASWSQDGNYVLGHLGMGRMERDMQREILLGNSRFGVAADYANRYTTAGLQVGHRFNVGMGTLTPYLGTQALRMEREAFTEQGAAGFGLSTAGSTLEATQALGGLRMDRQWQWGATALDFRGRLEWQRTLSQTGEGIDARFTGIDAWSPIAGTGLGGDATVFGLGVGAALPVGRLTLDVDSRRQDGQTWTGAFANWAVGF